MARVLLKQEEQLLVKHGEGFVEAKGAGLGEAGEEWICQAGTGGAGLVEAEEAGFF